ncbi:phosphodiester glycosidase family protein [Lacibacter sp. H407]|uniref:phosphodiester glycosidase family protein n=1 Tax=Lacibacter sp. H407 TaxID=3133423 RepID=UPI0030C64271
MKKIFLGAVLLVTSAPFCLAQVQWQNVDSLYGSLPSTVHVFRTTDAIDGKANIAYYVIADLKDRKLNFTTDTTYNRRFTPQQFYERNQQPLLVVNGTFFDFATNRNLNAVIKNGKLVSYNVHTTALKGKDTLMYMHTFRSGIGISKKRKADVAWLYTDSSKRFAKAFQQVPGFYKDSSSTVFRKELLHQSVKWKMQTAIAGGPALIQNGKVAVSNNQERMFIGKAIDDKHPRTAMGYTTDGKLIILVVQGRMPGVAEGASLTQLAKLLLDLGCVEALNLDGGGSSTMLVNGKETIKPSDKEGQRPVPGVFMIQAKNK